MNLIKKNIAELHKLQKEINDYLSSNKVLDTLKTANQDQMFFDKINAMGTPTNQKTKSEGKVYITGNFYDSIQVTKKEDAPYQYNSNIPYLSDIEKTHGKLLGLAPQTEKEVLNELSHSIEKIIAKYL